MATSRKKNKFPNKAFWTRTRGKTSTKPKKTKFGSMTNHDRVLYGRAHREGLSVRDYLDMLFLKGVV